MPIFIEYVFSCSVEHSAIIKNSIVALSHYILYEHFYDTPRVIVSNIHYNGWAIFPGHVQYGKGHSSQETYTGKKLESLINCA